MPMKKKTKKTTTKSKKSIRPWGGYEVIEKKDAYWIKKLFITKGEQTSLQSHNNRKEVWVVVQGKVRAIHGNKAVDLSVSDILNVKEEEKHRLYGITDAVVLEVAFGKPRETDITRYDDDYGRVT